MCQARAMKMWMMMMTMIPMTQMNLKRLSRVFPQTFQWLNHSPLSLSPGETMLAEVTVWPTGWGQKLHCWSISNSTKMPKRWIALTSGAHVLGNGEWTWKWTWHFMGVGFENCYGESSPKWRNAFPFSAYQRSGVSMAANALGQQCSLLLQAVQNCSLHCHSILSHIKSEARSKWEFLIVWKVHVTP